MGFFDWVMHGLGFENTEKKNKKQEPDKYENFNMHETTPGETNNMEPVNESAGGMGNVFGISTESNVIVFEPKNHQEIRQVVDYLKQGQTIAVNLEGIAGEDRGRILDFLSGAIYGLSGSIHRLHGDYYILAPEGHKILRKE